MGRETVPELIFLWKGVSSVLEYYYMICRDEFTVKILHSSFCDPKIELRSSWCDLCSSFFWRFGEKLMLNSVMLSQLNQSMQLNILKKKKIVLPLQQ